VLTPLPEPAAAPASLHESINRKNLETSIQFIKGVGPKLAEALARKGVHTAEDALYLLPHRYEDRRELRTVATLRPGHTEVFAGEVLSADLAVTKGGKRFFEVLVGDGSGSIVFKWFHYNLAFIKKTWKKGRRGIFTGEVSQYGYQREVHHPEADWLGEGEELAAMMARDPVNFGRIVPVYHLTEGVHQKTMRKIMKEAVDRFAPCVESLIPRDVAARHALIPLASAFHEAHFPDGGSDLEHLNRGATPAHRTLVFDELFFLELGLALKRRGVTLAPGIPFGVTRPEMVATAPALTALVKSSSAPGLVMSALANHPKNRPGYCFLNSEISSAELSRASPMALDIPLPSRCARLASGVRRRW
jgi:ATP-dependent DNA helicase RecG